MADEFQPGDIIVPKQRGASRLRVLEPVRTSHGKLRLEHMDSNRRSLLTTWWTSPATLPVGFHLEQDAE